MDAIQGRNLKVGLDENTGLTCKLADIQELNRGVAGGRTWGARDPPPPSPPLGRPSFEQTTYNIQVAKTP